MNPMSRWYLRLAVLYLIAGVALGLHMAASHDHSMHPVHAHLNLLGWVTMALFGLFYRSWPGAAASRLAKVQFWIYVPAHAVQMLTLPLLYLGHSALEPVLALASVGVGLAIVCFAVVVWKHTGG